MKQPAPRAAHRSGVPFQLAVERAIGGLAEAVGIELAYREVPAGKGFIDLVVRQARGSRSTGRPACPRRWPAHSGG